MSNVVAAFFWSPLWSLVRLIVHTDNRLRLTADDVRNKLRLLIFFFSVHHESVFISSYSRGPRSFWPHLLSIQFVSSTLSLSEPVDFCAVDAILSSSRSRLPNGVRHSSTFAPRPTVILHCEYYWWLNDCYDLALLYCSVLFPLPRLIKFIATKKYTEYRTYYFINKLANSSNEHTYVWIANTHEPSSCYVAN